MRSRYDQSDAIEDITCTCSRKPLLARLGNDHGTPFLEIKSVRSGRVIVHVKITGGVVEIACRECLRTHRINMGSVMEMPRSLSTG
jgi:hypothetical protein